ncbi:excinuclease ABC subunit UvrB [Candidatus Fermentibacteria bacterium]|nr:excinuclease ABC subunit UvrB [Candidatus Fermentibacteria bacterium]
MSPGRRPSPEVSRFSLRAPYGPAGDQPVAIEMLVQRIRSGNRASVLLGVTGSGKTFTVANVIARVGLPTLIISHNKTLAAQLYGELREYFPHNAVEYFISYYDYYQPEAYVPQTDTYIEKDASINEEIEKLRLKATSSLMEREDVIVVASVSCIYGLGNPRDWGDLYVVLEVGGSIARESLVERLLNLQYERNDVAPVRGCFRIRGDAVEVFPAYGDSLIRLEFFGAELERICTVDPVAGATGQSLSRTTIYPAHHFVTTTHRIVRAIGSIEEELASRLAQLRHDGLLLEAQRLESRTRYDLEMLRETGFCAGIENYSRHLDGRAPGERPACLLDYFRTPFLTVVDESHVTLPQLRGMWAGDRSRKMTLVEHGFRLPSALDNRPLVMEEFMAMAGQMVLVSATPGQEEIDLAGGEVVEQIIRPTGLVDPPVVVRPAATQMDDLLFRIRERTARAERVLVTTLTKRLAEDIADYLTGLGIRVRYLHSEIDVLERVQILRDLRLGEFDVVVGINLLREGLDLPEVSLVAILDADREGFLRSSTSLIQTAGRAARHARAEVVMYADTLTGSMQRAMRETDRRRTLQLEHNQLHGIVPTGVIKTRDEILKTASVAGSTGESEPAVPSHLDRETLIELLRDEMLKAASRMEFETAARLRDRLRELSGTVSERAPSRRRRRR